MTSEEWLQKAQELMDNSTCWESVEDELLKLYCLFSRCSCEKTPINGVEVLTRQYVVDKLVRVLSKVPIILDNEAKKIYVTLKMQAIKPQDKEPYCNFCGSPDNGKKCAKTPICQSYEGN